MEAGNINIIMSNNEVKDIIRFYLCTKGHIINREDIIFNISGDYGEQDIENCVVKIKV